MIYMLGYWFFLQLAVAGRRSKELLMVSGLTLNACRILEVIDSCVALPVIPKSRNDAVRFHRVRYSVALRAGPSRAVEIHTPCTNLPMKTNKNRLEIIYQGPDICVYDL